jgi:peptidoglycan/LPS O-acetylase OafA/YrhL
MIVSITNAVLATEILGIIFLLLLIITSRHQELGQWFPPALTAELKGLAILMIISSHIGYFLVSDHHFLWPLSTMAGIGVNLFLFLSGLGLAASQSRTVLTVWQFYKKRLLKLFIPFWLMLATFLAADFFILHLTRPWWYVGQSILGIFTHADLYSDINSPLWYFTFILGYYLLFPLVFSRKRPWLSAFILYLAGYLLVWWSPAILGNVLYLYRVHFVAFPLGILAYWAVTKLEGIVSPAMLQPWSRGRRAVIYYLVLAGLLTALVYVNVYSGVGVSPSLEQLMSILAVIALSLVFILKKWRFPLLSWFGLYSYEIYLWHWPIMYRYDFIYRFMPGGWEWLATALYLVFFLGLGWVVSWVADFVSSGNKAKAKKV